MLNFLLSDEGQQAKVKVESLVPEERENLTITLRNQRTVWRDNPSAYRDKHQDEHRDILQQGII